MPQSGEGFVVADLSLEVDGLNDIVTSMATGLDAIVAMRKCVERASIEIQAQAVRNVSGITVEYSGGTFIINRQTGKLVRSIQILPDFGGGVLSSLVVAGANYAAAVEFGTQERDLKELLMGKVIPFQVKGTAKEKKEAVADGTATAVNKYASTGKKNRVEYIAFRKIGPNSKGWIIPAQPARPFMQAAAEVVLPKFRDAVAETLAQFINDS